MRHLLGRLLPCQSVKVPVRLCCRCQGSAEVHAGLQQATGPVQRSLAESLAESLAQPQLLQTLEKGTYGQIPVSLCLSPLRGEKRKGEGRKVEKGVLVSLLSRNHMATSICLFEQIYSH